MAKRFGAALLGVGLATLTSAAGAADAARDVRVVVISDLNESYGSTRYAPAVEAAVARIRSLAPDLVISTGDMVAGQRLQPPLGRDQLERMWAAFHREVSDPLAAAGLPLAVTPGNHDASSGARFRLEREVYREQWLARKPALEFVDAAGYPFHYAFAVGPVLFISLDATHIGHLAPAEKIWLRNLLRDHGKRFRQRLVFSHVPIWPFAVGRERDFLGDAELEGILRDGGVEVHLSGHHHAFYPGYKDGVRFVSQGCLGAAPRALLGTTARSERSMTVIDFTADGRIRIEALRGPSFTTPIARSELPPRVVSSWATIVRDDLSPSPTAPSSAAAARAPDRPTVPAR